MATKKIQIEFDLNTNEVKLAGEATLSLAQQVRILQKELSKTPEGTKEFELLRRKLNDTKDNFDRVNAKSRELFGTLSLLPGPVGEIAGKLNGAISLFKTFSGFSFKDLKNQFIGLKDDIKGIFENLGRWGETTQTVSTDINNLNDSTDNLNSTLANVSSNAGAAGDSIGQYANELAKQKQIVEDNIKQTQSQIDALGKVEEARYDELIAIGEVRDFTKEESDEIGRFTEQQMALNEQLNQQIETRDNLDKSIKSNTVSTKGLTVAQQAAATAGRILRGVLISIGIGALIIGITTLITKVYEWATSTKAADAANEKLGETISTLNRILEDNLGLVDEEVQANTLRARAAGKTEKEIQEIERQGFKDRLAILKKGQEDLFNEEASPRFLQLTKEQQKERSAQILNDRNKLNDQIQKIESQARLFELKIISDSEEGKRKKRDEDNQDRKKDLEELKEFQRQADLTLMEAKDREIAEVQDKYKKQIDLAKKYRQDITDLVAAQAKEILEINKKYDEELRTKKIADYQALITIEENQQDVDTERLIQLLGKRRDLELKEANLTREQKLAIQAQYEADFRKLRQDAREKQLVEDIQASEGNFEKQIELYRQYADEIIKSRTYTKAEKLRIIQETNDKILSLEQQRFDNEKTKLELKREQDRLTNTEYYDELDALYVKELERAKQQKDQLIITEAEYNKRVKELSDARNNIRQAELDAEIATFQAIGQGLGAVSQLIGENTKQGKALAVAATLINTYAAIAGQLKAFAGVPIPGYAIAQAIATGLVGFAQVKKILSTQVPATTTTSSGTMGGGAINVNQRRAQGGMIFGAGSDSSDSIPAMLSNGEFVVNARSTRVFRPLLESMNSAANLPQFAVGGLVSGPGMTPPQSQNETIADAISSAFGQTPIRTYVTANDVSTQQQFDRIIKSRSLI